MNFSWPYKAAHKAARRSTGRARTVAITAVSAAAVVGLAIPAIAATARTQPHVVAKHSTTTTESAVTGYVGSRLTLAAQVKGGPTPTGTVEFSYNGRELCSAKLSGGKADCWHVFDSAGSFRVEAYYEGNSTHKTSWVKATVHVLALGGTATTVTATPAAPYPGEAVTLSATVTSSSAATGRVTFSDGAGTLCTATLAAGTASCDYTWEAAGGPYTVTGRYGGDARHAASSGTAAVTVALLATTTLVTATPADPYPGQSVTLTATVTSTPAATGSVAFTDGAGALCTATLAAGTATCDASWEAAGAETVTGTYGGDAAHAGSHGTAPVAVTQIPTTTMITNPSPTTQPSGPWTIDVTVTAPDGDPVPTGNVEVASLAQLELTPPLAAGAYSCPVTLDDGAGNCQITTPAGAWGFVEFEATYAGTAEFAGSVSTGEHKLINPEPTTTTVTPDAASPADAPVTLVATVTPEGGGYLYTAYSDIPDVVNFTNGGEPIPGCTGVPINDLNVADCSFTPPTDDTYAIEAAFPGDEYAAESDGTVNLVVTG